MMKLKLNGIILIETIITILQAYTPISRYKVVEGESGRYLGQTNAGNDYICHYYERDTVISNQCYNQNKNYSSIKLPYMYEGQSYPACPPLPKIKNGYWKCPRGVFSNSVEVYASCAAQCSHGFNGNPMKEIVVRCPESLQWENFADLQCIINNEICQLWNLSFIASKPFQVIISWNATKACQEHNFTFVMIGPKQNLTKRLQKNTTFMVVKDVDLDTTYEVFLYNQKEHVTGKFRSAARVSTAKDVRVDQVNTTAVNIIWEAPENDSSVIGYMMNITDGDNWFTLNTSDTSLVVCKLETGKNYTITVAAFNLYSRSLLSEPAYIELPVSPAKDVRVDQVNTTAVNIIWEAPVHDYSVIGYMVNIADGDNWFTLNTSDTSLVVCKLETGKNYTITVAAFNQNSISLQSKPVDIELQEKSDGVNNNNDKAATITFSTVGLIVAVVVVVVITCTCIILMVYYCKRRRKPKIKSRHGGTGEVSSTDQNAIRMDTIRRPQRQNGSMVESSLAECSCSDPLLGQKPQNPSKTSQETNTPKDMGSLESPPDSLNLSEAEHLDPNSLCEEASGLPLRSDSENLGISGNNFLKEVDKNVPKKWSRRSFSKKAPGSDSGRGSETGTCSTVSDGDDPPNRSSQSSQNSSQSRRSRQLYYNHQDSVDSGRVSDGETVKESKRSTGAEKIIPIEVPESCLTDISEKSVEQDSSVEIPVSEENEPVDPEECSCTFSYFFSTVNAKHVHDLGDLLDPHEYYGDERSWKSIAEDVLNFKNPRIVAIQSRTKKPFEEEVLPQLVAKGKKIGHMVLHFSRVDHIRKDVLELIRKIHSDCLFCDKILGKSLEDTFEE